MDELKALRSLARAMGVHTRYIDGLGQPVRVAPETLLRVCAALGPPIEGVADAPDALRAHKEIHSRQLLPPVLVAWDGLLSPFSLPKSLPAHAHVQLADGDVV